MKPGKEENFEPVCGNLLDNYNKYGAPFGSIKNTGESRSVPGIVLLVYFVLICCFLLIGCILVGRHYVEKRRKHHKLVNSMDHN